MCARLSNIRANFAYSRVTILQQLSYYGRMK
jgi:hypothetical protein